MSDATIFPATDQQRAKHGFGDSAFHHASLDPDASARLAAMDRALSDDTTASSDGSQGDDSVIATLIAESTAAADETSVSPEAAETQETDAVDAAPLTDTPETKSAEPESIGTGCAQAEPTETAWAEPAVEEISIIETTIVEADLNCEPETAPPAPLEVAPILDASGQLQPEADQYTPPAPFVIHVPEALAVGEAPVVAAGDENLDRTSDLAETFDLDSLCAPADDEQIVEQASAQEEAVAEMSAAAEEFVAEQIASGSSGNNPAETAANNGDVCAAPSTTPVATDVPSSLATAAQALNAEPVADRRRKRRALISSPIRVRGIHVTSSGPDEITSTVDVSRYGLLFYTVLDTYQRGMDVAVVFPYHKSATGAHAEQFGRVVRLHELPDGRQAVAIALGVGVGEHLVDSNGRQLASEPVQLSNSTAPQVKPPMVLAIDSDTMLRNTMKLYLQNEGYEVIAVSTASDAREVLNMFMPAMIVAEMEGEGELMPGLDLCAHVKSSPSLKKIPVVLTSRSGYPSDYSNAHSLGAVVCMAKPYKMERLGHIVRLLAPLPEQLQPACTQRPPDRTRGFGRDSNLTQRPSNGGASSNGTKKSNGGANGNGAKSRFKFPSFR
jgi:CheY-like chemotaxis protein